ncbi:GGDEF domain-containing protein [Kineococcus rubinsiae]|uniref:GGDEF domain-containing protein n=1 Tax=Kineococcus rubinsiae TaxID=2609562 RepID=UPI00142FF52D|nr:GGDEF domain-containing protein [Kineococcus rubinsiae]
MDTRTGARPPLPPWLRALAVLCVVSLPLGAVPDPASTAGTIAYLVPVLLSVLLSGVALGRVPRAARGPWAWLTLAQLLYLLGETRLTVQHLRGDESWPSVADAAYLLAYVPVTLGLLGLNRQRGATSRGNVLDAGVVTLSAATLFGAFFVLPLATDSTQSALARTVSSAYPIADVVFVFLLARLLTGPGARTRAYWFLVAGTTATLSADVLWNVVQLTTGADYSGRGVNLLWQSFYLGLALATCSASASTLAERKPAPAGGLTPGRLVALAVAAVLPALVQLGLHLAGRPVPTGWLSLGSVLLVGLVVARIWDLLQQVRSQAVQLAALARTDPLTGIANRRTWDHELSRACAQAQRTGTGLLVALLDLDHFKLYNDARGHQAGDELLKAATAAWTDALGADGLVARWGGEEFAVFLPCDDVAAGLTRLDALRAVVPDGQSCSIGAARWDGVEDPPEVLRRADAALYVAKSGGRNRLSEAGGWRPEVPAAPPAPLAPAAVRTR